MARVAIDALSQVVGGGVSVARDLSHAMAEERPQTRFDLFCVSDALAAHPFPDNVRVIRQPGLASLRRRTWWQQVVFPGVLRQGGYDALLGLGGFAIFRSPVPQVSVWQNSNVFTRVPVSRTWKVDAYIWLQRAIQGFSMRRAEGNVFLTRDSLGEAATRWDMDRIPHVVIPHGVGRPAAGSEDGDRPEGDYVLTVGHLFFHKNYEALIEAAARYRERFGDPPAILIAGGVVDAAYERRLDELVRRHRLEEVVRFLGPQPAARVAALYAGARACVVTSRLESFGLTPLEAMTHDVPVLAGRTTCLPEVCHDAALYCDPHDPDDIAEKLHRVLRDEALRSELRTKGRARVARFSWSNSARSYLAALAAATPDTACDRVGEAFPGAGA